MNLPRLFMQWMNPLVMYLDKEPVSLGSDGVIETDAPLNRGCRILILGKHAYFETTAAFPITDLKEIKAAVTMDQAMYAPFATDLIFLRKIFRKNEHTLVNIWFVRPSAINIIEQLAPWIVFPETALWSLAEPHQSRLHVISRKDDLLMVHVDDDGAVRSSIAEDEDTDFETFKRSVGPAAQNCSVERLESTREYFKALLSCLSDASITDFYPFFRWRPDFKNFNTPFAKLSILSLTILIFLYGSIWAGLPYWKYRQLIQENEKLSENLGDVLDKQAQIESIQQEIQQLAKPFEAYTPKLPLLNMLYQTISGKATIKRMTIAANFVEIGGTSPQASAVLSTLSAVTDIENVQLTAPLKKDRKTGQDIFSLSFRVKPNSFLEPAGVDPTGKDGD